MFTARERFLNLPSIAVVLTDRTKELRFSPSNILRQYHTPYTYSTLRATARKQANDSPNIGKPLKQSKRSISSANSEEVFEAEEDDFDDTTYIQQSGSAILLDSQMHIKRLSARDSKITPYWLGMLSKIEKPVARNLFAQLTTTNALGYESQSASARAAPREGTLLDYTIQQKNKHPNCIILMRCGEFYETYGVDALMLVAYAGLNPMGNKCKAGCPVRNIQATLDSLTSVGLSVAVYEEIADIDNGRGRASTTVVKSKERELYQIVSPAFSLYTNNLCLRPDDIAFQESQPAVGILHTAASGFTLCEVYLDEKKYIVSSRLTEEAVRSLLAMTGFIEPLYFQSDDERSSQSGLSSFLNKFQVQRLYGNDELNFPRQVLMKVGRFFEARVDEFYLHKRDNTLRPRAIYTSTAQQIGLARNSNVPELVPHLLTRQSYAYSTDHMQALCACLSESEVSLPKFSPVAVGKVMTLLGDKQCNIALFRELYMNIHSLLLMLSKASDTVLNPPQQQEEEDNGQSISPSTPRGTAASVFSSTQAHDELVRNLLQLSQFASGLSIHPRQLMEDSQNILELIQTTVNLDGEGGYSQDTHSVDKNGLISNEFFRRNEEEFRFKLNKRHPRVEKMYKGIAFAADALSNAVSETYLADAMDVSLDLMDNSVFYTFKKSPKLSNSLQNGLAVDPEVYIPFIDRKGREGSKKRVTTAKIKEATTRYLVLVGQAVLEVSHMLRTLSEEVNQCKFTIIQASHWAVILETAASHTAAAKQQNWILPEIIDNNDDSDDDLARAWRLAVQGMSPYWMDRSSATRNDVDLEGMCFLTAPNMSGKSTLMRSLLVVALLANCGLFVPSLVMVDELGKGTSTEDGCAISGSLLEYLDRLAVCGIFATHLHELLRMNLNLKNTKNKKMDFTVDEFGDIKWTYKLSDGVCTDSMALVTAKQYDLERDILPVIRSFIPEFNPAMVEVNYNPPVSFEGHNLYVGETASIMLRLEQHRRKNPTVRISALVEKVSNKSQARQKEKALIKMLKKQGVFLLSDTDQSHQLFGSGLQDIVS
eukprot:gene29331-38410_t